MVAMNAPVSRTLLFRSNRSQALRLPKDVAFPDGVSEVAVVRDGNRRLIVPADTLWDDFFANEGLDLPDRSQPEIQTRDRL